MSMSGCRADKRLSSGLTGRLVVLRAIYIDRNFKREGGGVLI